jgi:hypothetical protein
MANPTIHWFFMLSHHGPNRSAGIWPALMRAQMPIAYPPNVPKNTSPHRMTNPTANATPTWPRVPIQSPTWAVWAINTAGGHPCPFAGDRSYLAGRLLPEEG